MKVCAFSVLFFCFTFQSSSQFTDKGVYNKVDERGLRQGYWRHPIHSDGGERISILEGIYYNGIEVGVWNLKTWKGVIVKQYIYYDTLKHKVQFNEYHENQNLKSSGFKYPVAYKDTIFGFNEKTDSIDIPIYIDSILMMQGKWIYYHENGQVKSEGLYKNNLKKGCWKYYNERGEILKMEEF